MKNMNTQLTDHEYNCLLNAMRNCRDIKMAIVEAELAMQKLYCERYYKEKIVKCAPIDDAFLNNIVNDKRILSAIKSYNEKHPYEKDLDFQSYVLKFDYVWTNFMIILCNDHSIYRFNINKEYEWKFIVPKSDNMPTFKEYTIMCAKEFNKRREEEELKKCEEGMRKRFGTCSSEYKDEHILKREDWIELINENGKKSNIPINKYDKDGNLIETYKDRQECIEKNGISKGSLSNHLSGKRKTLKGYIYMEEL